MSLGCPHKTVFTHSNFLSTPIKKGNSFHSMFVYYDLQVHGGVLSDENYQIDVIKLFKGKPK